MGSGWCSSTGGFCWPTLPVASDSFSCFFFRRFMRSRIQLRIVRVYHTPRNACNFGVIPRGTPIVEADSCPIGRLVVPAIKGRARSSLLFHFFDNNLLRVDAKLL